MAMTMGRAWHRFGVMAMAVTAVAVTAAAAADGTLHWSADGALRLARQRLAGDGSDAVGRALVQFALALEARNPDALFLLSRLDDGAVIAAPANPVAAPQYVAYLSKAAAAWLDHDDPVVKTRGLMACAVVKMLDADHREASVALMQAKLNGRETDFLSLLAAHRQVAGDGAGAAAAIPRQVPAAPPDSVPPAAPPDSGADPTKVLANLTVARFDTNGSRPADFVNELNRNLAPHGVTVLVRAQRLPVTVTRIDQATGAPLFAAPHIGGGRGKHREQPPADLRFKGATALEILEAGCKRYGLSYKVEGSTVVIVDGEADGGVLQLPLERTAEQMIEAFRWSVTQANQEYEGRQVTVTGAVHKCSESRGVHKLELADGKVEILMSEQASWKRIDELYRNLARRDRLEKRGRKPGPVRVTVTAEFDRGFRGGVELKEGVELTVH